MRLALVILLALAPVSASLKVAVFRADTTPAMGEPNIWVQPVTEVLDPLLAKGIVISDGKRRYVIAAIDYCGIGGSIDLMLRTRMARAADTKVERVALQSVHQHSAPYIDGDAYRLLALKKLPPLRMSDAFLEALAQRLESAVRDAVARMEPFDRVGTGKAQVERVAGARRILKDGKLLTRYSSTASAPELREEPEGAIDTEIRTITLARGTTPLVRLHYYASHPQTFCCDGRVSADFVGAARERLEKDEGVPQIYFTGCGGDVTVGKYNTGTEAEREALATRLFAGMRASAASTRYDSASRLTWRTRKLRLPVRKDVPEPAAGMEDRLAYRAAITAAFAARKRPLAANALHVGGAVILHLPGEPLIEFQKFAQEKGAPRFVAVAGYGDLSPGYLCPDAAYTEGGYEPGASNAGPGTEARVKEAIEKLIMGVR